MVSSEREVVIDLENSHVPSMSGVMVEGRRLRVYTDERVGQIRIQVWAQARTSTQQRPVLSLSVRDLKKLVRVLEQRTEARPLGKAV
jgi:hypothetical protein